jgi:hypothetical protein
MRSLRSRCGEEEIDRGRTTKLQTLIQAFSVRGIEARRRVSRFHQQRPHHRVALFADHHTF